VGYDDPLAQALDAEVQVEYVERYGGPDVAVMDPAAFAGPDGSFLVALVDGTPVGCIGVRRHDEWSAEVKRMFVRRPFRGRGLARALLAAAEEFAAGAGYRRLVLSTGSRQPEALALYASAGYSPVPAFGDYAAYRGNRSLGKDLDAGAAAG